MFQKHDAATGKFRFRKLHGTGGVEVALKENEEYIEISLAAVEGLTGYVCYQNIHLYGPESPYPPDYYYYFHKFVAGRLVAVYESSSNNPPEGYGELLQEIQMNNGD